MFKEAIHISSDDRSGSTMLDLALASHEQIFSVGEAHNLSAYIFNDRTFYNPVHELKCMCGKKIEDCDFWNEVEHRLGFSFKKLRLRVEKPASQLSFPFFNYIHSHADSFVQSRFPALFLMKFVQVLLGYDKITEHYFLLYKALSEVSKKEKIVDSSKWPFRFKAFYDKYPDKLKVILLYRDPRAVVYSKFKRREETIESAAKKWADMANKMELFGRTLPSEKKIKVRYEDICSDPKEYFKKICSFLGVEFSESMMTLKKVNIHHVGGSPSKFDKEKINIKHDNEYTANLDANQLQVISKITANAAKGIYG